MKKKEKKRKEKEKKRDYNDTIFLKTDFEEIC